MRKIKLLKPILISTLGISAIGTIAAISTSCACNSIKVQEVTLDKSSTTLNVGQTETLTATVLPEDATDKKVNWTSSDTNIATVENGTITAKGLGKATIIVTSVDNQNAEATCEVTVNDKVVPVTGVTLNKASTTLTVGQTEQLDATVSPDDATNKDVTWSSSDTNIATVENGTITAVAEGTATITVKTNDGGFTDICKVNVTNPYVAITANEDSTLELKNLGGNNPDLQYSIDNVNWPTYSKPINITHGQNLYLKGYNPTGWSALSKYSILSIKGDVSISGNVMGLLDNGAKPGERGDITDIPCDYCFFDLFYNSTGITSVSEDFLPATTLTSNCYNEIFRGCSSLTKAPDLPATVLGFSCYERMFENCTSLTTAPELPATNLATTCYCEMFQGCRSLTKTPELPATTLAEYCYAEMFLGCTSLTTAPELPARDLADSCYVGMFAECSSLKLIKIGYTGNFDYTYFNDNWVRGIANSGTFYYVGIQTAQDFKFPSGWGVFSDTCVVIAANDDSTLELKNEDRNNPDFQYSTDGTNWTPYSTTINVNQGQSLFLRGNNPTGWSHDGSQYSTLFIEGDVSISGNVMGLLDNGAKPGEQGDITDIPCDYCFFDLFYNSTGIKSISDGFLSATTLANGCYYGMFYLCTSLTKAPKLNATNLANSCYKQMFFGCTALTNAPDLPATSSAEYCYQEMFQNCTSLTKAPKLHATALAKSCYSHMFDDCSSLTTAPELPATSLAEYCYYAMFNECKKLTKMPKLPAMTLATNCYHSMFSNCVSLISATFLPATNLANGCYVNMFSGCKSLNSIEICYGDSYDIVYFQNWVDGVASSGIFYCNGSQTAQAFQLPNDWKAIDFNKCLTITANEDSTFTLHNNGENNPNLQYSIDGNNWTTYKTTININKGHMLCLKGNNPSGWSYADPKYSVLYITGDVSISGNVMCLLDDGIGKEKTIPRKCCFNKLFLGSTGIKSVNKDFLPATTLEQECYYEMFNGCSSLRTAPELPATTLVNNCYHGMFQDCTSLTKAPDLPATTLANGCYYGMFRDCSSLITAPKLPAASLVGACYMDMFNGCTSLTIAPELPATTLAEFCYRGMFAGCTSLETAPDLYAISMQNWCYMSMFEGCTSLTKAPPILPATYVDFDHGISCYQNMFNNCSSLTSIKIAFTGHHSMIIDDCWVVGIAPYGTFYYNGNETAQDFGFPSGWKTEKFEN